MSNERPKWNRGSGRGDVAHDGGPRSGRPQPEAGVVAGGARCARGDKLRRGSRDDPAARQRRKPDADQPGAILGAERQRPGSAGSWSGSRCRRRSSIRRCRRCCTRTRCGRSRRTGTRSASIRGFMRSIQLCLGRSKRELTFRARDTLAKNQRQGAGGIRTASWDFSVNTLDIIREMKLLYDSSLMADERSLRVGRPGGADGDCRAASGMDSR